MVEEQCKWLLLVASVLQPLQTHIGNDVGGVPLVVGPPLLGNEVGIVVVPLPRENFPVVEVGGIAVKMPLADHSRLVASLL